MSANDNSSIEEEKRSTDADEDGQGESDGIEEDSDVVDSEQGPEDSSLQDDGAEGEDGAEDEAEADAEADVPKKKQRTGDANEVVKDSEESKEATQQKEKKKKKRKDADRSGVVYLSRIPPFMKPEQVRHLLSQHGQVRRVYLAKESEAEWRARRRAGGNKRRKYTEGWVEFVDRRDARRVARTLNLQPVGGKRRSPWYEDLWNIKYLKGFRWTDLTERLAQERRTREQRLRAEISHLKRENTLYLDRVQRARTQLHIEARKARKAQRLAQAAQTAAETAPASASTAEEQAS